MSAEIRNCEFRFQCPKTWDALKPTEKRRVRFCESCQRTEHDCTTQTQLYDAIVKNQCVAVEIAVTSEKTVRVLVGDLSPAQYGKR